jgi:hypothetical protein
MMIRFLNSFLRLHTARVRAEEHEQFLRYVLCHRGAATPFERYDREHKISVFIGCHGIGSLERNNRPAIRAVRCYPGAGELY